MEPEAVKRRGRKRKRKDGDGMEKTEAKKREVATKSRVLIGRYVKKDFEDSGEFLGKIVSYDTGLYRVDYEDGDCEDLETKEVKGFIVEDGDMDAAFYKRKKSLDAFIKKKYANKTETVKNKKSKVDIARSDADVVDNGVELANVEKVETSIRGGAFEVNGAQTEADNESTSDFSDYEPPCEVVEIEVPLAPPPELPPSSRIFGVSEEHVSYLLSVYSFLRSFSVCLFLSPFGLDEFVGALNCTFHNSLLDAIHVALIRALKSHVENLSSEGSELASKCLRIMDWSLLDSLTWPVFVVQYLTAMGYAEGPEWKEFYVNVLERDYYTLSAGKKLTVLQLLCDDASNSAELRAEIDNRVTSEVGPDPDGFPVINNKVVPDPVSARRRGRPPKVPLSDDHETVKNNSEIYMKMPSSTAMSSVSNATGSSYSGGDVDDDDDDGNGDECRLCGMDGTLICCDGCPSSYHSRCIGVMKMFIPEGEWYCPECIINRLGPNVTKTTSLRGAEFFGIDPYEQVFLGSCDHLLVMKASRSSDLHIRYYSPVDIKKVLHALTCSAEYMTLYLDICKGILQHWEIPEHVFSFPNPIGLEAKESGNAPDVVMAENINGVADNESKDAAGTLREENCKELGLGEASLDKSATCITENGNCNITSNINGVCDLSNLPYHKKEKFSIRSYEEKLYTGSSFKPHAYLNVYIHGDFAASAGASLAILSSEEKLGSQSQPSNHRKFMTANFLLQARAFSLAAKRFYWPNYEKKLVEVSRERCGWCLSCKSSINSKRGCLLNAAASNAIKGPAKILASLRSSKNVEASLASVATYVMFMEESLCGLSVGPFLNRTYKTQWRKQVEEAATLGEIKAHLLELERNIRDIAFSADWTKLVDDVGFENQVVQSVKSVVVSNQKRGPGRRGRKPAMIIPEVTESDDKDSSNDVAWWRGGMLSKHIFQKGTLPQMLIKHAARQGGCVKINGVQYFDGLEIPKRSRQFLWRAAVDMSKTASQLALQVRYLDIHVRWNELLCPEQPLQDGKGLEAEASAFRNACIVDKKVLGNKISYGVIFENQKHLPSRVLKKVLEVEETGDKKEKNWFLEMHIPLYLIKEYEVVVAEVNLPTAVKHVITPRLNKKQLKASGKNIFSFLEQKRDNKGNSFCTFCQLDVPFRSSAKCSACQGYCHEQCAIGTNIQTAARVEFLITCKRCCIDKDVTLKNEIAGDSPTSPLLLQGQKSQHSANTFEQGKQNSYEKPFGYSNQSSQKKISSCSQQKKNKSGKKNQSEKKPKLYNSSTGSKKKNGKNGKLVLGLIWKRRNQNDTGIEFRLNNVLLKDNPNGRLLAPICHLCTQPYNADLMYIRCEKCQNWFHAESAKLEESKVRELFGFKCCRCRRIRIPICPYTDPETRMKLESKKEAMAKLQKQKIYGSDYDSASNSDENEDQLIDWELDSNPVFDSEWVGDIENENQIYPFPEVNDDQLEVGYIKKENQIYPFPDVRDDELDVGDIKKENQIYSFPEVTDDQLEVDPGLGFGPGPKKLPIRRHIKQENETDVAFDFPNVNPAGESSAAVVEWDVSNNGFEDNMMFDCEDLKSEPMEFEPQTYFSFNELLASDENVRGDQPDPPAVKLEQYEMGIAYAEREPMFSVENELDMAPCNLCSLSDPMPDLFCVSCNLWIHQSCSPWEEDSSWEPETGWKCGQCRTWS